MNQDVAGGQMWMKIVWDVTAAKHALFREGKNVQFSLTNRTASGEVFATPACGPVGSGL